MPIVLETSRLRLRHFRAQDVNGLWRVISDDVAMQYYPQSFQFSDAVKWIARNRQRYKEQGHGLYAVELKSTGEMIGDCGLVRQHVAGGTAIEVGYHLRRDYWGQGYATEAAWACMGLAFRAHGAEKVISLIRPENVSSRRVAERNGMEIEREVMHAGLPHLVYAMRREEYERREGPRPLASGIQGRNG